MRGKDFFITGVPAQDYSSNLFKEMPRRYTGALTKSGEEI
jgi:hypothetical protein